jgi:hypothetical protein
MHTALPDRTLGATHAAVLRCLRDEMWSRWCPRKAVVQAVCNVRVSTPSAQCVELLVFQAEGRGAGPRDGTQKGPPQEDPFRSFGSGYAIFESARMNGLTPAARSTPAGISR